MKSPARNVAVDSHPRDDDSNALWTRNIEFLREHMSDKSLATVLHASEEVSDWTFSAVPDRRGNVQYRPLCQGNYGDPLHSARDPEGEAQRQVQRWTVDNEVGPGRIVVVFGLGAAFHLHALARRMDKTNGLLIVDANPGMVAGVLRHIDLSTLGDYGLKTVQFVVGRGEERVFGEFFGVISKWPRLDYSFFIHPGTQRAFADIYNDLSHRFAEKVRTDMLQRSTVSSLTKGWLENALRNLPNLLGSTPLQCLEGAFSEMPAVVVAAGPSLADSLDLLRELRRRAIIITVGTAYRPLLAAGIDPHLIVLVDGSHLIAKQFEDVATDIGRLVVPPHIDPSVVRQFRGRLISWQSGALPEFRDWMRNHGNIEMDSLGSGGTVTYSAIDAARYFGCSDIYTFGLDLAFKDDGQTHVGNSMYSGIKHKREGLVPVKGNLRPQVWTTRQFATYIELLAGLAAVIAEEPDCRLLNVNTDGAHIPNMDHCLPSDIHPEEMPVLPSVAQRLDSLCTGEGIRSEPLTALIDKTVDGLAELEHEARSAAELCHELADETLDDEEALHERLHRLQVREKRLGAVSPEGLLLSAAVRASSMETVAFCAGIAEDDESGFRRVHERCAEYYAKLAAMTQWLITELDDSRNSILEMANVL